MFKIDDSQLAAYLDGELDGAEGMRIDEALLADGTLRARLQRLRRNDACLAGAFDEVMEGPMPVLRAFERPAAPEGLWALLGRWFGAERGLRWQPVTACALVLLVLGGSGGYWVSSQRQLLDYQRVAQLTPVDRQLLEEVLNQTLETRLSGDAVPWHNERTGQGGVITPVRTFKTEEGRYCREFKDDRRMLAGSREQRGIACRRDGGDWQVQARYFL